MIDNIKDLWSKIDHGNKGIVIQAVADKCGAKFGTVKSWWLAASGGFSVPEKHLEDVLSVLQNMHKLQEEVKDKDVKSEEVN